MLMPLVVATGLFRLWRRRAFREVAVAQPPRGHQRPSVFRNVDSRAVRDHEPVDRNQATLRGRVPDRGNREVGASVGSRGPCYGDSISAVTCLTSSRPRLGEGIESPAARRVGVSTSPQHSRCCFGPSIRNVDTSEDGECPRHHIEWPRAPALCRACGSRRIEDGMRRGSACGLLSALGGRRQAVP